MVTRDQFVTATALMMFFYNTSGVEFADLVFPNATPDYQAEKAHLYAKSYAAAFGKLDHNNQKRVIEMAMSRYAAHAGEQWDVCERLA